MQLDCQLCDDAQSALTAYEQVGQVITRSTLAHWLAEAGCAPVWQHYLLAQHPSVLRVAVCGTKSTM